MFLFKIQNLKFKIPLLSLLLLLFCFNSFADITLSIYPTPVVAGEENSLVINSSEGKAVIKDLPKIKGLQWLETDTYSKNLMVINGVKYIKTTYPFIVKKPGRIKVPSMTVSIEGGKDITTAEKELLVSTGPLSDLESLLFLKCSYSSSKNVYYVGEEIPLKVNVYRAVDLKADPAEYPQIKMDNVIFDNFKNNKQTDKFAPYPYDSPKKITKDGIDYIKTVFYTSFRSLVEGKLKGFASLAFNIELKKSGSDRSSPFDDDFFSSSSMFSGSFFNRNKIVTRILTSKIPEIELKPLPPLPGKTNYLGLIGNWNIKESVKYETLKEGEPITLSLDISGYGTAETVNAPEINISGFNTYSPEVITNENGYGKKQNIKIDYILIPTESGKTNLNLSFSIFDTKSAKYKTAEIKQQLDIQKGDGESVKNSYAPQKSTVKQKKSKVSNSILYSKVKPDSSIKLPLYKNYLFIMVFLLIIGPASWILFELFCFRKKYITGKKGFKRRNKAAKKRNSILKSVRKTKNIKELSDIVQEEIVPYINDIKDYPPGTTAKDLETKLNNRKLSDPLIDAEASAYMPSNDGSSEDLKKKIIKIVKHFSMFIIFFSVILFTSNNTFGDSIETLNASQKVITNQATSSVDSQNIIHDLSENELTGEFTKLYNKGKFNQALEICKKQINLSTPNPDWIYNLGNCYYQKGNLAKAMVCYERALRLSPRDSDILENLNLVRRKLFLPEVYQTNTPLELVTFIRDYLRPDEWMLIFCFGWFMIFVSLIIKRLSITRIWFVVCMTAVMVCVVSAVAFMSEKSSLYNSKNAVIVEQNVKVYSLPTKDSADAGFSLHSGDSLKIEENVENWIRIRKGKTEGWINKDKAEQVWPY